MDNKKFTALLGCAGNAAEKHRRLADEVTQECIRRHGVSFSDVDADSIIDMIDLIGGKMTAAEFDAEMRRVLDL